MYALRSYTLLIRWQALRLKTFLPLAFVVQSLFAFGIVVGYPLFFPQIDQLTILFLATGAPAVTLITMGVVVLPGVVFGVAVGAWAFDLALSVSIFIVPAVLLVVTTAAALGYAKASVLPPMMAMLLSQVLVFGVLLFSPINYPVDRLPEWMQTVHSLLPVQAMGEVVRGSLASDVFPLTIVPFVTLGIWCAAALTLSYLTLQRRA